MSSGLTCTKHEPGEGRCKPCRKNELARARREADPEKYRAKGRTYRWANIETIRARERALRGIANEAHRKPVMPGPRPAGFCYLGLHDVTLAENRRPDGGCRPCRVAARRTRDAANRSKLNARMRAYRKANPERIRASDRGRDRERRNEIAHASNERRRARKFEAGIYRVTARDLRRLKHRQRGLCAFPGCDGPAEQLDHRQPISRDGRHAIGNLDYLCGTHNMQKHTRLLVEFRYRRP